MTRRTKGCIWLASLASTVAAIASPVAVYGDPSPAPASNGGPVSKATAQVAKMAGRIAALPAGTSSSTLSDPLIHVDNEGRIHLAFRSSAPAAASQEADLAGLGAVGVRGLPAGAAPASGGLLHAWLPHHRLAAASELPWVSSISPPAYGRVSASGAGATVTEGVSDMKADLLQAKGITGAGVTVGVVSDGVTSLATAQAAGELPAGVTVVGSAGIGDEGTAMLEIVHDMAPGASLVFAPAGDDLLSFLDALNRLAAAKVNVIVHDIAFDTEPVFEQGFVAATIDTLSKTSGIAIYAAAGNVGITHVRVPATGTGKGPDGLSRTFAGCTKQPTNVVAIAPNGDTTFDVGAFGPPAPLSTFVLHWSEPSAQILGQGAFTNLDLYILDEGLTTCLGEADNIQANGVGDSLEALVGGPQTDQRVKVVVNVAATSSAVAPPILDLRWREAIPLDTPSRVGSINPNNNFTSGLPSAVAALDAETDQMEPFSGAGPIELVSTTVCPTGASGPCTGVPGPPGVTLLGPAFTAVDNVSVSGAGGFPTTFLGTSASAPHAAGCDALVRQAIGLPGAPILTVRDRLSASAADVSPAGIDASAGAGLLDCLGAARISNLKVSATAAPDKVGAGGTLTYTVNVKNDGPDASAPFTVLDTLPVGVTLAGAPATCTGNQATGGASQVVSCPQAALPAGQSASFTLTATASSVPEGTTMLINQISLQSPFDNSPADNAASLSTAFEGTTGGGPIVSDALARTGGDQGLHFWVAVALMISGGGLWLLALERWRTRRPRAAGDGTR